MVLTDKVVLVTGGASGLGAACVRMAVLAGGQAVVLDRNEETVQALVKELGAAARFVAADVTDAASLESALSAVGPLHVAVTCAGIAPAQRVVGKDGLPQPLEAFSRVIQVNLIGTFNMVRLAAAAMAKNEPNEHGERGVIVTTASVAAYEGQIGQAAYAASKAGVAGMTLPLARELARFGIRVVSLAPGVMDTPMVQAFSEEVRQSLGAAVPFPPRLGKPKEFALLARHVIENPYLNGTVLRLDGALRMAAR